MPPLEGQGGGYMFDLDLWSEIISALKKNRMRSFMTAFGVFWGIFMLIVMSGAGKALENGVLDGVKAFATNSAFFWTERTSVPYAGCLLYTSDAADE